MPVIQNTQIHHLRENDSSSCNSSLFHPDEQVEDPNIPVPNESVDCSTPEVKITLVHNKQKVNKICHVVIYKSVGIILFTNCNQEMVC